MSISQQSCNASPNPAWLRTVLSQIGNVVRGASPRPAGDPRYFNGDFMPWLTVAALTNIPDSQLIVVETAGKLTEAGAQFSRTLVAGTVIIANSGATLGVAKILGVTCCANDGIAALLDLRADVEPRYVVHQINSQTDRLRNVVATGNGQPNLNTNLIGAIEIDLPCRDEQSAISDALDASNALIDSLEQLLSKKRQIKQGAMNEFFSQKRRIPGFVDVWTETRIGDFTDCTAGGTPSTREESYWGGSIPWMSSGDLHLKRVAVVNGRITEEGLSNSSTKWIPASCVLIGLAGQGKTRGTVAMNLIPLCTNQSIAAIFPCSEYDSEFLYHNLDWRYDDLRELSAGDGGRGGLNLTLIRSIIVPRPSKAEQHAIAEVLSDMDTEIIALESRLTKALALKQAMAQALLTGRIRLVEPNV